LTAFHGPPAGREAIAGQPSFFSAKTKPCLGRARKAIMQRVLMATL